MVEPKARTSWGFEPNPWDNTGDILVPFDFHGRVFIPGDCEPVLMGLGEAGVPPGMVGYRLALRRTQRAGELGVPAGCLSPERCTYRAYSSHESCQSCQINRVEESEAATRVASASESPAPSSAVRTSERAVPSRIRRRRSWPLYSTLLKKVLRKVDKDYASYRAFVEMTPVQAQRLSARLVEEIRKAERRAAQGRRTR